MAIVSYTKIENKNLVVQLKKNSFPTLDLVPWGDFAFSDQTSVTAQKLSDGKGWVRGGTANQTITGAAGIVNVLDGGGGNDTIIGQSKDDFLYGGTGNDSVTGGDGNDAMSGGDGNDTLRGEKGNDWLYGDAGDDLLVGGRGADTINGGAGNDRIFGDDDTNLSAPGTRDVIFAGDGNDTANGGVGDDFLYGEAGNDSLMGDGGNDTIVGGQGDDTLTGGAGADAFVLQLSDAKNGSTVFRDTITDFTIGTDKLWIEWANYTSTVTQQKPLEVDVSAATGGGTLLKFDFKSNGAGTDYQVVLSNIDVASLGSGTALQQKLNDIFIVYNPLPS